MRAGQTAVDPDDNRSPRYRQLASGGNIIPGARRLGAEAGSCRLATLCRCWRTVLGFVVPMTGRMSLSKATVRLKEISEVQRVSRYRNFDATCR
jgi:hypothetical protein